MTVIVDILFCQITQLKLGIGRRRNHKNAQYCIFPLSNEDYT